MSIDITFLSPEQLRAVYQAIITEDGFFVTEMAKCALSDGCDIIKDMYLDDASGLDTPDENDIRQQAKILVEHGFGLLHTTVESSITSLEFRSSLKKTLTGSISFAR